MQTFKIYTLGCKVNQYDSQIIRERFEEAGLKELNNGKKADYYIINSCTVTGKADSDSRYFIGLAKRQNPKAKVIACGCYAHLNADDIKKIKGVDLILDNNNKYRICEYLFLDNNKGSNDDSEQFGITYFEGHTRAFVKIQDGCNNFCSFCKVPYVRGRSRSRNFDSIINEVENLSKNGFKEIVLTGICLGDYGKDFKEGIGLVDLIDEIERIDRILRIRLSSIEARDVTDKLILKIKSSKKLCPHLHIPFQSGDNDILEKMNRGNTREDYLALADRLNKEIKNIAITTDIMIGFLGETENNFRNTTDFLNILKPAKVHIFTFNKRDATALGNSENNIPQNTLKQRYTALKLLTDRLSLQFKKRFLGREIKILFEEEKNGFWQGYSSNYLLTCVKSNVKLLSDNKLTNNLIKVKVKDATVKAIFAELI